MIRILSLLALMFVFIGATNADAAKRVALVIGNSNYEHVPKLENPRNDAEDLVDKLKVLGFEVQTGLDQDFQGMRQTIRKFVNSLKGADLALFFYAGHGLQVNGENYMAPIDAHLFNENDLEFEAVPISMALEAMERNVETSIIFLDACRNNPLARNLARSMGTRSAAVGRGLARIETGIGTLISFATQPGNVALDGKGRNSPFTNALLKHIDTPGEDIGVIMRKVRQEVISETDGLQVPWDSSSLIGSVVLNSAVVSGIAVPQEGANEFEVALWNSIKDTKQAAFFETYLGQFPTGQFAALAKSKLRVLKAESSKSSGSDDRPDLEIREELNVDSATDDSPGAEPNAEPGANNQVEPVEDEPIELDADTLKGLQLALSTLGHDPGPTDGQYGPRTRSAIGAARKSLDLPPGDHVDLALLERLPDTKWLKDQDAEKARKYNLVDLPENADPRLRKAIRALSSYEMKFGYFEGKLYIAALHWGQGWRLARSLSEQAGGHLVTLSSKRENDFVYKLFASDNRFLSSNPDGQKIGPYIGLYQEDGSREPAGGWVWVTGEAVGYKNWSRGQPNNFAGKQKFASFHTYGSLEPGQTQIPTKWDDNDANSSVRGFIVEIE